MGNEMLMGIINNAILLLGLGILYSIIPIEKSINKTIQSLIIGLFLSMIVIFVMLNPFEVAQGVVLDTRSILISVAAFFFGFIPVLIVVISASILRISDGGSGVVTGVLVIVSSGIIGLLFRKFRYSKIMDKKIRRLIEFYIFAFVVHVVMLIMFLALPEDIRFDLIIKVSPSVLIVYPIVTVAYGLLMFFRYDNVTEREKLVSELIKEKQQSEITLLSVGDGVIATDKSGIITLINVVAENLTGWKQEEAIGKNIEEVFNIFNEYTKIKSSNIVNEVIKSGSAQELANHTILLSKIGEESPIEDSAAPIIDPNGEITGVVLVFRDLSEKQQKRYEMELLLNSTLEGIYGVDKNENCTFVNKSFLEILGFDSKEEILGKNMHDLIHHSFEDGTPYPSNKCRFSNALAKGEHIIIDGVLWRKDGTTISVAFSQTPQIKNGEISGAVCTFKDITERKQATKLLEFTANNDFLTGLHNRRYFEKNLLYYDKSENLPLTIVMADINGLKLINDAFGHESGDKLLIYASNIITESCKEQDLIARIGGDEFVIVMPNTNEKDAEKIINTINKKSALIKIESLELSISFGYKSKTMEYEVIQDVYRSAEDLMYREKLLKIPSMRSNAIETILNTLYEKDKNSEIHSRSVSLISEKIAIAIGMSRQDIAEVKTAGLLHDIGKIITPLSIINKVGKLSSDEYSIMKNHSEIGFRILNSTQPMRGISNIVLNHHERWDGMGYPRGIKQEEIPIKSRIISIADAFDAMTSERTYRDKISDEEALKEIIDNGGTQFDPKLVKILKEKFKEIISSSDNIMPKDNI
ncbi:MAG: Cyclic di-GMP phosphodiesterase response regulator RpfG [Candidatus Izimaplasma bacterium HR2]|nr:MAG: Cyclic di-GMP phosphodiesterase response regulator RpfG [Candidatus Izimaplasma bacterium HR2]